MHTNNLTTCIECGHTVSLSAATCPSCNSRLFKGQTCAICLQRAKENEVVKLYSDYTYYHPSCIRDLFQPRRQLNCKDCGEALPPFPIGGIDAPFTWPSISANIPYGVKTIEQGPITCKKCGSRDPIEKIAECGLCSLPVFSYQAWIKVDHLYSKYHEKCHSRGHGGNRNGCSLMFLGIFLFLIALFLYFGLMSNL